MRFYAPYTTHVTRNGSKSFEDAPTSKGPDRGTVIVAITGYPGMGEKSTLLSTAADLLIDAQASLPLKLL